MESRKAERVLGPTAPAGRTASLSGVPGHLRGLSTPLALAGIAQSSGPDFTTRAQRGGVKADESVRDCPDVLIP